MTALSPDTFFDLSTFSHASLFDESVNVWDVLPKIESYIRSCTLDSQKGEVSLQAYLVNPELIAIEEGAVVEPGAYIKGPCIIGRNSVVRHGAYIRGNAVIGENCVVGHCTEVKNAVFLNGAQAGHFAYVGDSILGNRSLLGAGVKLGNFKLNKTNVLVRLNGGVIETGLRKFGAILGDRVQLGCNTVTNPGTLVGKGTLSLPNCYFGGYVPENSSIKHAHAAVVKELKA